MAEKGEILSEGSDFEVAVNLTPGAKCPKVKWQETLVNLVAVQQQQIALLTSQSQTKSVTSSLQPTPNDSRMEVSSAQVQSFKITSYDKSSYPINEWLEDCSKLK